MTAAMRVGFNTTTMKSKCLLAVLLLSFGALAEASGSLRCGSRLVSAGDSAASLLGACGEPALRDAWRGGGVYGAGALAGVEQWTYNFGSGQLLRVVELRQGRIERIDSEGYGFPDPSRRDCSAAAAITAGMTKYRLLSRCGAPLTRVADHRLIHAQPRYAGDAQFRLRNRPDVLVPVYREEWTYNFGSSKLLRIVILDNGSVSDVRTGERGFD